MHDVQFRVLARASFDDAIYFVSGIACPFDIWGFIRQRKPGKAAVRPDCAVVKTIVADAPSAEYHHLPWIDIDHAVRPPGRNHNLVSGFGLHGKATPGIVRRRFLHVDDCFPLPNLEQLWSRTLAMT